MRVRAAKLRGCVSIGLVVKPENDLWEIGQDVSDFYNTEKYIPPVNYQQGDRAEEPSAFIRYTDIENMRNNIYVFENGEKVVVTEKLHGCNSRLGKIDGEWVAGSHNYARKKPEDGKESENRYWFPYTIKEVKEMVEYLSSKHKVVIVFGEIYGSVQKHYSYDAPGKLGFRVFDIYLDNRYVDWDDFVKYCTMFGVQTVPVVEIVEFSLDKIKALSEGTTLINGAKHIREGVVVKPLKERYNRRVGRVILKYVSDSYLGSKSHEEDVLDD
jgi:RNA ligase (TIGR02306 family)